MVKYTGRDGKDYVLRFDMSAMEAMRDKFGGYAEGLDKVGLKDIEAIRDIFVILAQAGAEYTAEAEGRICRETVTGEGLLTKHSSIGRIKGMMIAIREAVKDGQRMQSRDEEDEEIRDGYLEELRKQEAEKN